MILLAIAIIGVIWTAVPSRILITFAASANCFMLLWHDARRAFSRARANTGNRIAANNAMIAITTKSSIKVNPLRCLRIKPPFKLAL